MNEQEEKVIAATISARVVETLVPMMDEVDEFVWSLEATMNQMPTARCGTYIIPQEKGVLVK
jgi:hypothetical protein